MTNAPHKHPVVQKSLSMRPIHYLALTWLAVRAGHLSRSRVNQQLIEAAMRDEFGENWEARLTEESAA